MWKTWEGRNILTLEYIGLPRHPFIINKIYKNVRVQFDENGYITVSSLDFVPVLYYDSVIDFSKDWKAVKDDCETKEN